MSEGYRRQYGEKDPGDMPPITIKSFDASERETIKAESETLIKDYLANLRNQFYPDAEKRYFQDKTMLIQTITLPARSMWKKGVFLDDPLYRKILNLVIDEIKRFSKANTYQRFGGYFLVSMQRHLKHHEEEYIAKGKDIRDQRGTKKAADILTGLTVAETPEQFTTALTDLSHLVSNRNAAKKAAKVAKAARLAEKPTDNQLSFL